MKKKYDNSQSIISYDDVQHCGEGERYLLAEGVKGRGLANRIEMLLIKQLN